MKVVSGISSQEFGARLARKLGLELLEIEYKTFPDNEQYLRLKEETNEEVIVVQSITSDKDFVTLLLLLDALKGKEVITVIPYFGYARQDKKFKGGEPISSRALIEALDNKTEMVITIDVHDARINSFFDKTKFKNLTAFKVISKKLEKKDNQLVVAPDEGAINYAEILAGELGCEYDYLEKDRKTGTEIELEPKDLDVDQKEVIIVDDLVSTGGTMSEAIKVLKKQGAEEIKVAVTHPVFAQNALQKIYSAGADEVISTDTIETSISNVSATDPVAEEIK